jgi:PIN domain-containing protein
VGNALPRALLQVRADFEVRYHQGERFRQDLPDDEWLHQVGPKRWIVFSFDAKWQDEAAAIEAIRQHKVGCFYLYGASSLGFHRLAGFVRSYEKVIKIVKTERRPYIYKINGRNQFKRLL